MATTIFCLAAAALPARAQTVVIDTDQTATVVLPATGGTAEVMPGVLIQPPDGAAAEGLETSGTWQIINRGTIHASQCCSDGVGVRLTQGSSLDNHGSIRSDSNGGGVVGDNTGGFTLINRENATISGTSGVHLPSRTAGQRVTIVNNGTITASYNAIAVTSADPATEVLWLENTGRIESSFGIGVSVSHGTAGTARRSSITNRTGGVIKGGNGNPAVFSQHGKSTIVNEAGATIQSTGVSAIYGSDRYSFLDIDNAGMVTSDDDAAIRAYAGGKVLNRAGGTISGAGGVAFVRAISSNENTITNAGTIRGSGTSFVSGTGAKAGAGAGIYIGGAPDSIGTTVNNLAGGSISGTIYGIYSGSASQPTDAGPVTVDNAGSITGATGIRIEYEPGYIVNSGTIAGTGGTAIAFSGIDAQANTLVLQTGSVIDGQVLFGGLNGTLVLEGEGIETASRFDGVANLTMRGEDWTYRGDAQFFGKVAVESGVLRIDEHLQSPTIDILAGATLSGIGVLTGTVTNAGTIAPGTPTPGSTAFGTLTIQGDYVGMPGSALIFNTELGTDGSPSDQLILDGGHASGSTQVVVHNAGGTGDVTHGDGIELIAARGATTTPDAFTMSGELRVGAFSYALLRGGLAGNHPDSWFLRSEFMVPPPVDPPPVDPPPVDPPPVDPPPVDPPPVDPPPVDPPPVDPPPVDPPPVDPPPVDPPPPTLPIDPPPSVLPPGTYPIIGPELATWSVVQPLARQLNDTMLGTLHERQGEHRGETTFAWVRAFGGAIDNRYRGFPDPSVTGDLRGLQAGSDLWQGSLQSAHRDHVGVFGGYGEVEGDVGGLVTDLDARNYVHVDTGHVKVRGTAAGAYWTHVGPTGWYVDTVVQGTRFDGYATTQYAALDLRGDATTMSVEAGVPIALDFGPGFVLEPQAQLAWQGTSFEQRHDGQGNVDLGATRGVAARLGTRALWNMTVNGRAWTPYLRLDYLHDFGGLAETWYDDRDVVPLRFGGSRMQAGAGLHAQLTSRASFYANLDYGFGLDAEGDRRFNSSANLGLRFDW